MYRIATHSIAFSLGVLALSTFANLQPAPTPPTPGWVSDYCADASPCVVNPTEAYQGIALAIQWLMPDPVDPSGPWVECPPPAPGEHPQTTCIGGSEIAHWFMLTRGDVQHGQSAVDHDVFVATDSPIYSSAMPPFPGGGVSYALGSVMAFGVPPGAMAPQLPDPPPLDSVAWDAYLSAWCAQNPMCAAGGSWDEARIAALEGFDATHVHDGQIDPAILTASGAPITITTGTGR